MVSSEKTLKGRERFDSNLLFLGLRKQKSTGVSSSAIKWGMRLYILLVPLEVWLLATL